MVARVRGGWVLTLPGDGSLYNGSSLATYVWSRQTVSKVVRVTAVPVGSKWTASATVSTTRTLVVSSQETVNTYQYTYDSTLVQVLRNVTNTTVVYSTLPNHSQRGVDACITPDAPGTVLVRRRFRLQGQVSTLWNSPSVTAARH